jgi:uncharacterized protein (DUF169 family)
MQSATRLRTLLGLTGDPIAISFVDTPPPGVARVSDSAPAGCSYWKLASDGETFYTTGEDHFGCPVGAHTHAVEMREEVAEGLQQLVGTMIGLHYLTEADVAAIPRLAAPFQFAIYAPADRSPIPPQVLLLHGTPRQIMLAWEAAQSAGASGDAAAMGRPACALVPQAINTGQVVTSLACIGNRVYTSLGDDEFYLAIPGERAAAVIDRLEVIVSANQTLEAFHRGRC